MTNKVQNELPENYNELKKAANRTSSWRTRFDAVEELGQYKHSKVIDVLTTRMTKDPVFKVQEAAYRQLKGLGEDVQQPKQTKFDIIKGTSKILLRIKKSLPADHSFKEFEEKFKKMRLDVYDAYEGEKGAGFDKWLENEWASLLKK
ncbi:HEAT repeat domain-containing protein [Paenisporosarcina sp. TG-14]|uniref:HEAT repeat domain-containing protein n=1 Tax=Paenisporosarcina sp. TG-14 TaxID=1231057 RepID=UPI00030C42E6|nr:HEAT repeat domain-containing protein [Paenisporosarcina sp. TG-14]